MANQAPTPSDDFATVLMGESVIIDLFANDSDPDGDDFHLYRTPGVLNGTNRYLGNGLLEYTPDVGFSGTDSFYYAIEDIHEALASAIVTVTVVATGDETLTGTAGDDSLKGRDGNDVLEGLDGNDTLIGGEGNDHSFGGDGDDLLIDGAGDDTLDGGDGWDILDLSDSWYAYVDLAAQFVLAGGGMINGTYLNPQQSNTVSGFEHVIGSPVADWIYADVSTSVLIESGGGEDRIETGSGNDTINAGSQRDTILSGAGDDWIIDDVGYGSYNLGPGRDTLDYSGMAAGVWVDFDNNTVSAGGTLVQDQYVSAVYTSAIYSAENVVGSAFADLIQTRTTVATQIDAGAGADRILTGIRNDLVDGGAQDDVILTNAGRDTILASDGSDTINGGAHFDLLDLSSRTSGVSANMQDHTVLLGGGFSGGVYTGATQSYQVWGVEDLTGTAFDDLLIGKTYSAADLIGGDGHDTLIGGAYNDRLEGGDGHDVLTGGAGFDTLLGQSGNDTLSATGAWNVYDGGADIDTLDMSQQAGGVGIFLHSGQVLVAAAGQAYGQPDSRSSVTNVENAIGSAFGDQIHAQANVAARLEGRGGDDQITGSSAADWIAGGQGDDLLTLSGGDDMLHFALGDGNDTVSDFATGDVLELAGYGADYTQASDVLTDLQNTPDGVLLMLSDGSSVLFEGLVTGDLAAGDFLLV